LFFKLPLDLSPFLHEVPLHLGSHEQILTRLGVRLTPSGKDYGHFLTELAHECHDNSLNVNELRAVKAIIEAIINGDNRIDDGASGKYTILYQM